MDQIYADIAARTGGNIYVGVVGPVRTGKSTLIKRIMEELVIPGISDPYRKERARDELPQSGSGKTIMTSEPKFVPEEAVEISPDGVTKLRVRLIDSVGYMVDGAVGAEEDGVPRMVTTPWYDHEIPMTEAAELGTKKVMEGHCSIGIVVTTDGTITEIPREDYVQAEKRAITDMQKTGKPFLVIVNSRNPAGEAAGAVKAYLQNTFALEPIVADCQALDAEGIGKLMKALLYTFPMSELRVHLPRWMDALEPEHPVKAALYQALLQMAEEIHTLGQAEGVLAGLRELPQVQDYSLRSVDLGSGRRDLRHRVPGGAVLRDSERPGGNAHPKRRPAIPAAHRAVPNQAGIRQDLRCPFRRPGDGLRRGDARGRGNEAGNAGDHPQGRRLRREAESGRALHSHGTCGH